MKYTKEYWDWNNSQDDLLINNIKTHTIMKNLIKNKEQMMKYIGKHMRFVKSSEEFNGNPNSIWVSGEDEDTFRGLPIYDYYACHSSKSFELGVNVKWEEQLQKYGWWSEWYDCGTVMIHPLN